MKRGSASIVFAIVFSALVAWASSGRVQVLRIERCAFDAENLVIQLSWTADSAVLREEIYAGITSTYAASDTAAPAESFRCTKLTGDTIFSIPNAVFDTLYTISLWTNRKGDWLLPDSLSTVRIRVASSYKQPISYFSPSNSDTLKALENHLLLWKGPEYPAGILAHDDTVAAFAEPDSVLNGYIPGGSGVRFLKPALSPAFFLALKVDSAAGRPINGFRIYKDSLGVLIEQRGSTIDSVNKRISCKINNVDYPYVVLADTVRPFIRVASDTARSIDSIPLTDTITVTDNGVNCTWKFFCAPGADATASPVSSGSLEARSGTVTCTIPAWGARAAGMRAFLTVTDQTFIDTVVLSRRAIRAGSDAFATPVNSIFPIAATSLPDQPGIRSCLQTLFSDAGNDYDKSNFRIFKWAPVKTDTSRAGAWIEFAPAREADFQCGPGALMWLITARSATIDFGSSTTVSLKAPYAIALPPRMWTDVGVPFGFDIALSDLIEASGPSAEKLVIYRWDSDAARRTYTASLVYGSKSLAGDSVTDTLFSGMGNGYTVYNPFDSAVDLRFPPIPASMRALHTVTGCSKKKVDRGYCIRVSACKDAYEIGTVYCGASGDRHDTLFTPSPPSFSSTAIRIRHPRRGGGAIMLYPSIFNGPAVYPLEICNGNSRRLSVTIRASFIKGKGTVENCLARRLGGAYARINENSIVETASGQKTDIVAVAGTREQIASFIGDVRGTLGAVAAGAVYAIKNGRLSVSFTNVTADQQCRLSVITMQGKCIFNSHAAASAAREGDGYAFDVQLPPGVFICKSSIYSPRGAACATRRIVMPK